MTTPTNSTVVSVTPAADFEREVKTEDKSLLYKTAKELLARETLPEIEKIIKQLIDENQFDKAINIYARCFHFAEDDDKDRIVNAVVTLVEKICSEKEWESRIDPEGLEKLRKKLSEYKAKTEKDILYTEYFDMVTAIRDYRLTTADEVAAKLKTVKSDESHKKEKKSDYQFTVEDQHTHHSEKGRKTTNEDELLIQTIEFTINKTKYSAHIFGVFDGHGGPGCAIFIKEKISAFIIKEFESKKSIEDVDIYNALKLAVVRLSDAFSKDHSGSTLSLALILNGNLWYVNSGDSRGVIGKKMGDRKPASTELSADAKATASKFYPSVFKRGGVILSKRLNGTLAIVRAVGDKDCIGCTARPKIKKLDLLEYASSPKIDEIVLIIGSDGLWDVMRTQEAVEYVLEQSEKRAFNLVNSALRNYSLDNVTGIVIYLKAYIDSLK